MASRRNSASVFLPVDVTGYSTNPTYDERPASYALESYEPLLSDPEDVDYSPEEEAEVVRILDSRLFPWVLLTTFVLNMDRTNNSNAISDNLAQDLGFTIDTVNLATALYSVLFSIFCLSGAVAAKIAGPSRWIPILMFSWGLVTLAHVLIKDKAGYLTGIAITEGGVIPATLVYLGAFYKGTELATRLAWFWGTQQVASATSGIMAAALLRLRGVGGLEGWKWLFLVDGVLTLIIAVATWYYLPEGLSNTKGGLRGVRPWFTHRQVRIAVERVIRDDQSKKEYECPVQWSDVKDAFTDLGLWGHLIITAVGLTPGTPLSTYLPTIIKSFDFNVFVANALTAPPHILQFILMLTVVRHSDRVKERGFHGAFGAGWQFVGWILLRSLPYGTHRVIKYLAVLMVASWPYTHPLNIAWMSENTGSIGKRTLGSGLVIGAANLHGTWGSQIYRADDAPDFKRGNLINIAIAGTTFILWIIQKLYYQYCNARNAERFTALTEEEKEREENLKDQKGNRSLTYRFTT
ncbi:MFS general substrate transporter [Pluteus cervinus]|uniref:MFS general substrate transporter n=1 Tax=Pluteus cervinus TaxID=181527 RepID=A0ACD3ASZ6_9AGAR|nr:MFS general substrate transporter [Pluteus cervinus]